MGTGESTQMKIIAAARKFIARKGYEIACEAGSLEAPIDFAAVDGEQGCLAFVQVRHVLGDYPGEAPDADAVDDAVKDFIQSYGLPEEAAALPRRFDAVDVKEMGGGMLIITHRAGVLRHVA